jgi:hypothetical protein
VKVKREPSKSKPVNLEPVKRKRTADDWLHEHGFGGKEDAEDPEEDDEDTEVIDQSDDEEEPVHHNPPAHNVPRADPGPGGPYCYGACGPLRHKCFGRCHTKCPRNYACPCPWEERDRLCESCYNASDDNDSEDYDEYHAR